MTVAVWEVRARSAEIVGDRATCSEALEAAGAHSSLHTLVATVRLPHASTWVWRRGKDMLGVPTTKLDTTDYRCCRHDVRHAAVEDFTVKARVGESN